MFRIQLYRSWLLCHCNSYILIPDQSRLDLLDQKSDPLWDLRPVIRWRKRLSISLRFSEEKESLSLVQDNLFSLISLLNLSFFVSWCPEGPVQVSTFLDEIRKWMWVKWFCAREAYCTTCKKERIPVGYLIGRLTFRQEQILKLLHGLS